MSTPTVKSGNTVFVRDSRYSPYKQVKVEKVYKSGNFTLTGSPQQWRPLSDGAVKTGRDPLWDHSDLLFVTPANEKRVARHNRPIERNNKIRRILHYLGRLDTQTDCDRLLDEIGALISAAHAEAQLKRPKADEVVAEDQSASLTPQNNLGTVELSDD